MIKNSSTISPPQFRRGLGRLLSMTSVGLLLGIPSHLQAQDSSRPNIILILADDLGYSDLGCYGGEIQTPNLDRLGYNGLRFSRFYNTSRSCPTRASLLTGLYPHQAGMGRMNDTHGNTPAYKGELSKNAVTIAEVLKTVGYQTGMVGKWHLSEAQPNKPDQNLWVAHQVYYPDFVERSTLPVYRGFDDFYGISAGAANYFDPFSLLYGEEPVREVPKDYYFTQAVSDSATAFVNRYSQQEEPFFLYMAYTAPHWPLHALPQDIAKYEDLYKTGWENIRNARYKRMLEMKMFGDRTDYLTPRNPTKSWNTNKDQEWDARGMAVYAAMIDRMDQGIGQVIEALERNGQLDNTLILFMSDNGCANELAHTFGPSGIRPSMTRDGTPIVYPANKEVMPGPETCFAGLMGSWTNACNTPFRLWKKKSAEGGICAPFIAYWPNGIKENTGTVTEQMGHLIDVMATCIDVAGATYPEVYDRNIIVPLEGKSLVPVFETGQREGHEELGFEHFKEKALITKDLWKICQPEGDKSAWELYNLDSDRTEMKNLAKTHPDKLAELVERYDEWAKRSLVKPGIGYPAESTPVAISRATDFEFIRNNMKGNFYLTADIEIPDGAEWIPLGAKDGADDNPTAFEGTFDGRGYTIKNLKIVRQGNFKGLFGRLKHAVINDLNLEVDMVGTDAVGGLSGAVFAETKIERVSVSGYVEGNEHVGGIVGRVANDPTYTQYNQITDCYVNAHVKARKNSAGGLIGMGAWKTKIKNAYVAGKIEANADILEGNAGGIVSLNEDTRIQAEAIAVVTDVITGGTPGYFFCRQHNFEKQSKLYARNDIPLVYFDNNDKGAGAEMSNSEMLLAPEAFKTESFYKNTLGWDFDKVWTMEPGVEYPLLRIPSNGNGFDTVAAGKINCEVYAFGNGIMIKPSEEPVSFRIFNLQGQLMYNVKNIQHSFEAALSRGTYLVNIFSNDKIDSSIVIVK